MPRIVVLAVAELATARFLTSLFSYRSSPTRFLALVLAASLSAITTLPASAQDAPPPRTLFLYNLVVPAPSPVDFFAISATHHMRQSGRSDFTTEYSLDSAKPEAASTPFGRYLLRHLDDEDGIMILRPHSGAGDRPSSGVCVQAGYRQLLKDRPLGACVGNGSAWEEPRRFIIATTFRF